MGSLLTARNLPGTGDFDPPEDDDAPICDTCNGTHEVRCGCLRPQYCRQCNGGGIVECPDCEDGYQPEPEYEPPMEREDS